ncbi:MAG TPA: hypothetical protein VM915_11940, partial [Verrucomicrobiae bacterium]|nr:hypothetical protein [Verrucomicrobiae bacterium]
MSGVKSFARSAVQLAALGASSLALSVGSAWAEDNTDRDTQEPITVVGQRPELESPRYTAPLLETPQ